MKQKENPEFKYAQVIIGKMSEIFDKESEFHIDKNELSEGENATYFFHALINVMPSFIYNTLSGEEKNLLEVNHIGNQLIFQYHK